MPMVAHLLQQENDKESNRELQKTNWEKRAGIHGSLQKQMWESKLPHKLWGMWKAVCRGLTNTTGLIRMLCVGFLGPPTSQTQPTLAVGNSNRNFVKDQLCESFSFGNQSTALVPPLV